MKLVPLIDRPVTLASLLLCVSLATGCRSNPTAPAGAVALRISEGQIGSTLSSYGFLVLNLNATVFAQWMARDSSVIGAPISVHWSSDNAAVATVRDTTITVDGARAPAAIVTSRGFGQTKIRASASVGGKTYQGEFSITVARPAAR